MKTYKVTVEAKLGKLSMKEDYDYDEPETLDEAIAKDGKKEVFDLYLAKRIIAFRDKERPKLLKKLTGKITALIESGALTL